MPEPNKLFVPTLLAAGLLATAPAAQTMVSGAPMAPEQKAYDVTHYDLALTVDPDQRTIDGSLGVEAKAVDDLATLVLDLDPELDVHGVTDAVGKALEYDRHDGRIWIALAEPAKKGDDVVATIRYGGAPRVAPHAPWDGGFTWAQTPSGAPWIATTCQTNGADLWWPCKDQLYDEPDSMDIAVTVPKPLVCASNGALRKVDDRGKSRTYHWHVSTPISNYCVALNIAPYHELKTTFHSVDGTDFPFVFYVLPEHEKKAKPFFEEFQQHVHWFEKTFGPYPFRIDKYGVAETPHLGMEHQSIIAYGNQFRHQSYGYDWLHHHELSHEWWGNLVTARDWHDLWIHEGIGTYCQALYIEDTNGEDAYHRQMREWRGSLANRQAVAPREPLNSDEAYGLDIYNKGAWTMHTLRWLIGKDELLKCLRTFLYPTEAARNAKDGSQCRIVDTDEFVKTCEKVTGRDLGWFFEVYLRQPNLPRLETKVEGGELHLEWVTPDGLPFPMPVEVSIGQHRQRVEMEDGKAVVPLNGPQTWDVDPDGWVLKEE